MARSSSSQQISVPSPAHQLLVGARKTWLGGALQEALGEIDPGVVKAEIGHFVPADVQRVLAGAGVRDEWVFPTPSILEMKPTLVGYYRLLLGVSQKAFYRSGTGMGVFKSMEVAGVLRPAQRARLPEFCRAMSGGLAELIRQMSPVVSDRDVRELPLLTLGAQFQGASNVTIGQQATAGVFVAIREIVRDHIIASSTRELTLKNSSGRKVVIRLGADPDVGIKEEFDGNLREKVAIEIKGGTDVSNVHNRAGEAEKSHQKAKSEGYRDFWTIIQKRGVDGKKLQAESPTTNSWFDAAEVLGREGAGWEEFKSRLTGEVGIPES